MRSRLKSALTAALFAAGISTVLAAPAAAQFDYSTLPERPASHVSDFADMLGASDEAALSDRLMAYESTTTAQIFVITVPTLMGETEADVAQGVFDRWKPGQQGVDNGVLLLVAKEERRLRIHTGYGIEGSLPDVTCGRIINGVIVPAFKAGDIAGGINAGIDAITLAIKGEWEPPAEVAGSSESTDGQYDWAGIVFFIAFMILITYLQHKGILPRGRAGGGTFSSGGSSWSSGGGGSSWGGGGGGFSGGGGASGGW